MTIRAHNLAFRDLVEQAIRHRDRIEQTYCYAGVFG
jgi:hypothetical protein